MPAFDISNPLPLPRHLRFLAGGGEATRLILARDWSGHPLGEPAGWPEALKATLSTVLNSPESMILAWGREELTFFFGTGGAYLLLQRDILSTARSASELGDGHTVQGGLG